mgnify:CR=1 FL=1
MLRKKFVVMFFVLIISSLVLSACSGSTATPQTSEPESSSTETANSENVNEPSEPASDSELSTLEGDVIADGSSTVFPVTTAVAEEFAMVAPNVRVSVGLSGTGGGFKKFCVGETDISNASRPIKDEEIEICQSNNIEFVEFLVALDGLTVMVNPENDWLTELSAEQLAALLGASSTITKWSDLDPSFPEEDILFFIPDPDSGTRDYMIEVVEEVSGDEDLRQDENTTFSSDDNVLLDGIANEKYAFGFFGFAYYINSKDRVKAVPIVNSDGNAVLPSEETVQNGTYNPLSRPLFIYVNLNSLTTKPQVSEFVRYYFGPDGGSAIMSDVGYSMPPEGSYEANLELLASALAGTLTNEKEESNVELSTLEGDVIADGSSTVFPVTTAVAEEFAMVAPNVRVSVGLSGTGGGFKKFCVGETDISNASRPIKDEEIEICQSNNIEFVEFLVALDGLTVMVNPENDWLTELSAEQLAALLGASSTITKWSDLDPSFPEEDILFFIPDPDSGTRDYMIEVVEEVSGDEDLRQDENTTFSSDDNVLLDGIANEKYAFGFFGFAYYINSKDRVKAVPIVNSDGNAVLPSEETVQNGTYNPLSRPLFIYVNLNSLTTKPQVSEFVRYYFGPDGGSAIMSDVGYSMPPEGSYEANLELLESTLN